MKRRVLIGVFVFAIIYTIFFQITALAGNDPSSGEPRAKYVFLFIGDGMGQAQVNLAQAYLAALDGRIGLDDLSFTRFPEAGFCNTYAHNRLITCSAAAGTALATGNKTNINRISMDPEATMNLTSVAAKAKNKGYKVGILTSVSIDHATPAVFYAHQPDRDLYFDIGRELTQSRFDLFAGGGFVQPDSTNGGQTVNLVSLAAENGFNVADTREEFEKLAPGTGKTLILSPRIAGEASMPYYIDMDPGDITLADFTAKAIDLLTSDEGFFMMVEGGKIDWACHANDAATVIQEIIIFSRAIESAVRFYEKHPDETLIIVTADHETGGLALGNHKMKYSSNLELLKYQLSSADEMNKIVSQFRVNKSGVPDADFLRMMKAVENETGLHSRANGTLLTDSELARLKERFLESVYAAGPEQGTNIPEDKFIESVIGLRDEKAGISWGSGSHTFVSVPVYAIGQGAEKFSGYIDNTDISKLIGEIMQLER